MKNKIGSRNSTRDFLIAEIGVKEERGFHRAKLRVKVLRESEREREREGERGGVGGGREREGVGSSDVFQDNLEKLCRSKNKNLDFDQLWGKDRTN
mmetsp:Transcript_18634/g.25953  ORF Transcript_18634/g.25953 Transcript_18634/m.25953 type:complete len:96 (-) Transcript_18634:2479-2766(-)